MATLVTSLRASKNIIEKKFGNVSSFNFSRDAFYDKDWNEMTTKARGLFIDTQRNAIVARSYEKFFNINERYETRDDVLPRTLQFPVTAYLKYNGFLGIVGYDAEKDDLFIASKSTPHGPFAENFRRILLNATQDKAKVVEYLRTKNKSLVFECIDPVNDPHIIEYSGEQVVLLDTIDNSMAFSKCTYDELCAVGHELGYPVKEQSMVFEDAETLMRWLEDVQTIDFEWNGEEVEGFVVEDAEGFMFKVKSGYYKKWKKLRVVAQDVVKRGYIAKTSILVDATDNLFYGWVRQHREDADLPEDIISLRKKFMEEIQI